MDDDDTTYLELADWRRRMAQLYVEARTLQDIYSPAAAHDQWRAVREQLYREHPRSPIPPARRANFAARHFAYDPALRFQVTVIPDTPAADPTKRPDADDRGEPPARGTEAVPTSGGGTIGVRRVGWLDVSFPAGERRLGLYWLEGYAGGLYLPFRDRTNGAETYGGGRYLLDAAKSADLGGDPAAGTLTLDFNFAYHPSCAFDPRWVCPLVPPENALDIRVEAGERLT